MNSEPNQLRKSGLLLEPTCGYGGTVPRKSGLKEVLVEWIDAVNIFKERLRFLAAFYLACYIATGMLFAVFFARFFSVQSILGSSD